LGKNWVRLGSFWVRFFAKSSFLSEKHTKLGSFCKKSIAIGQPVYSTFVIFATEKKQYKPQRPSAVAEKLWRDKQRSQSSFIDKDLHPSSLNDNFAEAG
jgi:hypothetical protein